MRDKRLPSRLNYETIKNRFSHYLLLAQVFNLCPKHFCSFKLLIVIRPSCKIERNKGFSFLKRLGSRFTKRWLKRFLVETSEQVRAGNRFTHYFLIHQIRLRNMIPRRVRLVKFVYGAHRVFVARPRPAGHSAHDVPAHGIFDYGVHPFAAVEHQPEAAVH